MNDTPRFDPITLPAKRLAAGWCAVWNATGHDKDDFLTYQTVALEMFPGAGVRLVAVNDGRSFLARVFVPELRLVDEDGDAFYDEPAADVAPQTTVVVRDLSKRVTGLMKHLLTAKPVDKDEDDESVDMWAVTIENGRITPDGPPTLSDLFDEWGVVFTSPRSKECAETLGEVDHVPHSGWRRLDKWFVSGLVGQIRFAPANLSAVAAVPSLEGVAWQMGESAASAVRLAWNHPVAGAVHGLLMPMRSEHDDTPTPDDDARADADEIVELGRAARRRQDEPTSVTITKQDAAALAEAAADLLPRGDYRRDADGYALVDADESPFDDEEAGSWFDDLGGAQ